MQKNKNAVTGERIPARGESLTGEYGVWCQCSGLLGFREAWLKSNDKIRRFETEKEAQQEAQRLMELSKSPYSHASFRYYASKFSEHYAD